jgi:zinc and cadmium transporter
MSPLAWVLLYSLAVLLFSLAGGSVPLLGRVSHGRLQLYLSLSAGVMLGASFFHVMPDAFELSKDQFGWWMALGVIGLFSIERFLAPHTHEPDVKVHAHPPEPKGGEGHKHDLNHGHDHGHNHGHQHHHHHHAPPVAGWAAVLGLTLHTFMNGFGLAGAVWNDLHPKNPSTAAAALPGLALFLAIVLHKPADALAISTVLRRRGVSTRAISLVQLGFALMVAVGGLAFFATQHFAAFAGQSKELQDQITGAALSFSAGTFLFIALSDLLPEVQFHRHDRVPLFLSLVAGVALMGGIAVLEDVGKPKEDSNPPPAQKADADPAPNRSGAPEKSD